MFGSITLEVVVGIIFIFILVSIICSTIRESIEAWLKTRAAYLEHGIREMLHDKKAEGLARSFYEHPLIYSLYTSSYIPGSDSKRPSILAKGGDLPSYIPAKNFAVALMDIAARGQDTDAVSSHPDSPIISLDTVRMNIMNLDNPFVQRALLTAIDSAQGDLTKAQENIEAWYDSAMDRVSGWYKRSTHWILFWIGIVVAIGLNVNTITIADYLFRNDAARTALVARAEAAAKDTSVVNLKYNEARAGLDSLNLPIGWSAGWGAPRRGNEAGSTGIWNNFFGPILGLLITVLAATMGAPFWFDLLNKVMVIRSTVKPHEKSQEEASEDRALPKAKVIVNEGQNQSSKPSGDTGIPPASLVAISNIRDKESSVDGCEVKITDITLDEQLPPAEGGVA